MIALVTGSRSWNNPVAIREVFQSLIPKGLYCVIHGDAPGADTQAGNVAESLGLSVIPVPAAWEAYGLAAGPERNSRMLKMLLGCAETWTMPIVCTAFHESPTLGSGTRDMVDKCMNSMVDILAVVAADLEIAKSRECSCGLGLEFHPSLFHARGMRLLCSGLITENKAR